MIPFCFFRFIFFYVYICKYMYIKTNIYSSLAVKPLVLRNITLLWTHLLASLLGRSTPFTYTYLFSYLFIHIVIVFIMPRSKPKPAHIANEAKKTYIPYINTNCSNLWPPNSYLCYSESIIASPPPVLLKCRFGMLADTFPLLFRSPIISIILLIHHSILRKRSCGLSSRLGRSSR